MSCSTILGWKQGEMEAVTELRNSHGSAPIIWNGMWVRYCGGTEFGWGYGEDSLKPLWDLYKRADLPRHHRSVLMMTFDIAYVAAEHFPQAAADIRAWLHDFPVAPEYVNHWPAIAAIYENNQYDALAVWHTSVTENPFSVWNEETEEYETILLETADEIYNVLAEIEAPHGTTD